MGVLGGEERVRKNISRNNGPKHPNLVKYMNLLLQEVQQTSTRINSKIVPIETHYNQIVEN